MCIEPIGMRELFQFTHPGRGATSTSKDLHEHYRVSIHAPREGCDCVH